MRRILAYSLFAVLFAAGLGAAFRARLYVPYEEGTEYAAIARGDAAQLHSYYAGRVLHPWAVSALARVVRRQPDAGVFRLMSEISLMVVFVALGIYYALDRYPCYLLFFAATPILIDQYRNYYWADLFYLALLLVFFLTLRWNAWLSLPLVFALYLTRESTMVLVVSLVVVAAIQGRRLFAAVSVGVGIAGAAIVSLRVSAALPNAHGVPVWMLDLLKVPFNFALNILGVSLWTNTIAATTAPPSRSFFLPAALRVGNIIQVGYIDWSWARPAAVLVSIAGAFGILPIFIFRNIRMGTIMQDRIDLAVARLFGGLMLILTPLTGTTPSRYILYAAPLFWIAGVRETGNLSSRRGLLLAGLTLTVAWSPLFVRFIADRQIMRSISLLPTEPPQLLVSLAVPVFAWILAWCFWRFEQSDTEMPHESH